MDAKIAQDAARAVLALELDPAILARMHDLAVRNQAGELSHGELQELDAYRRFGQAIDLLRAKAHVQIARNIDSVSS